MGSDSSPEDLFQAVLEAQKQIKGLSALVVFGVPEVITKISASANQANALYPTAKIQFIPADEVIEMEESPSLAIRRKKRSSMVLGLKMLAAKEIDAFVSAGNTGALVVGSRVFLNSLPGAGRPGLLALLPSQKNLVAVIDVGGNIDGGVESLVTFAKMGVAFQSRLLNKSQPSIGLLNIGAEAIKGTPEIKETYQILKQFSPHFVGNVEGHEVFEGKVDVVVTDGFTGNVFLKTSEGLSKFIIRFLRKELASEKSIQAVHKLESLINYDEYPGAILCGVEGIVIKCHGYSSSKAMLNGIKGAVNLVNHQIIETLKSGLIA